MTVLIYIQELNPRVSYIFKHICKRMLGLTIEFTTTIEPFIAHEGPKFSYREQPLGKELFFQSTSLLFERGISAKTIRVESWGDTHCFFKTTHPDTALPFDIFAASFYLITRYEEYIPSVTDALGRFKVTESVAYQNGFLEDPVVDIWVTRFKTILQHRFPEVEYTTPQFEVCPIILVAQTYAYKQKGLLRSIGGGVRDLSVLKLNDVIDRVKVILGLKKDPYDVFDFLIRLQQHTQRKAMVFFGLGDYSSHENNIHYANPQHIQTIKHVADYLVVGLKASYDALTSLPVSKLEKERLEHIIHRNLKYTSGAFFKIAFPITYRNLVALEVKNDYSMGYANYDGFRAGTCTPFLFYDLDYEVQTPLMIHSVCQHFTSKREVMSKEQLLSRILEFQQKVKAVNGAYLAAFTNAVLGDEQKRMCLHYIWKG